MGLFDQWPYTNFHELNLEWILRRMRDLTTIVENFVALNTIKYADPIQWNITTQYEANTVVVDPQTGTAYISSQPVPAGVGLTNTDYWSVIFTLDVISANKNITLRDDGSNVLATFRSVVGDWLLWNGTLYKVTRAINVNEAYVVGYNIDRYTVEQFIKDYINALAAMIGDLNDLTTTDKNSIVNAINELVTSIGDLNDLTTTDKDSIVDAINEVKADSIYAHFVNVKEVGAVGDGITDDTLALQNAINTYDCIYLPAGSYLITSTLNIASDTIIAGAGTLATFLVRDVSFTGSMISIADSISVEIASLRLVNGGVTWNVYNVANRGISIINASSGNYKFDEVWIDSGALGFYFEDAANVKIVNCTVFQESAYSNNGYMTEAGVQFFGHCTGIWIDNSFFAGQDTTSPYLMHIAVLIQGADGIYITNTGMTAKYGMFFTNQYAYVDDVYVTNCVLDNCSTAFIGSESNASTNVFNNIMFDNCHMDMLGGANGDAGVTVDYRIMNFKMSNSFIGGCSGSGIKLISGLTYNNSTNHDHSITNCYIVGVNQANRAGQVGITGQAAGCTINGNTITNSGIRSGHAKYAITIENENILVSGNRLDTMETDYIYQQGGLTNVLRAANLPASVNT